ncbi:hypothetical protein NE645_06520 [Roseburia hominis]|jgi:hypothetical protein|nr:hypothetical protein [Roseburia hominis]DAE77732.1 MAG TPA: hypothetical protein [Bacteriophage sp.]DAX10056.1 MAG TPA: hypothetical protein [Bacteriophage sp.]
MHKWAKQIMECVKAKVDGIGIDNFEGQNLDDLKDFTEIAKNIACFDKDYRIVEAMEKSEDNEDIMRMLEQYEDYPDRRYYDAYRYANGRFAPKGRGTRRGYEEPPYYHMYPEAEHMRDMDRDDRGKMYYSEPASNVSGSNNMSRNYSESNYDRAKRNYTETKELHKGNTQEDKEHKMKSLDGYMKELSTDITHLLGDMTAEEKNLLRTKLSTLVSKI